MIHLSQAAQNEIRRLQLRNQQPDTRLRLGVQEGGCSGLFYTMEFDQATNPGDFIYQSNGISVVLDEQSHDYLSGLTLDYSEDLMGGSFRFYNPVAATTCGCGHSFSL